MFSLSLTAKIDLQLKQELLNACIYVYVWIQQILKIVTQPTIYYDRFYYLE